MAPQRAVHAVPDALFGIQVVDDQTGRGVPLVELRDVAGQRRLTDSAGWVAIDDPALLGRTAFFHVRSHGYELPADGFGYHGKALEVEAGGTATLRLQRLNLAERLYRVTGQGIYRDSLMLGRPVPIKEPLLNGGVVGQDSVLNAVYHGRLYWFWGDTNRTGYPLGNFRTSGATSLLPGQGGLDPSLGVDLTYFVDEHGFARPMAPLEGPGPVWMTGLIVLPGPPERMLATYQKIKPPLETYERGLARWNDETECFEPIAAYDMKAPCWLHGHPFLHDDDGVSYVYCGDPYPLVRARADEAALADPAQYEAYTPLRQGSRDPADLDRDAGGHLRLAWKRDTAPLSPQDQEKLLQQGVLQPDEAPLPLKDVETGRRVLAHRGSVAYNAYRQRWTMILCQQFGTSPLGEIWYAEADAPTGPWRSAIKVVTHEKYSFYNPKLHPELDQEGGRLVYFEGTYTKTFSGNNEATPLYDYNQIMYRLDLSDPRLQLP